MKNKKKKQLGLALKFFPVALLVVGLGIAVVAVSGNSPLFNYSRASEQNTGAGVPPPPDNLAKAATGERPAAPSVIAQAPCVVTDNISWQKTTKKGSSTGYLVEIQEGDSWLCDKESPCYYTAISRSSILSRDIPGSDSWIRCSGGKISNSEIKDKTGATGGCQSGATLPELKLNTTYITKIKYNKLGLSDDTVFTTPETCE